MDELWVVLDLKWLHDKCISFHLSWLVYIDDVVRIIMGEALQIFTLAERESNFSSCSRSSLVQRFCRACVHFDIAYLAVDIVWRFIVLA